ncbi:MAG: ribosome silencing factor [Firmicutes bacterium]|nr:ribosome silencing factor [Bacillota bacterium]
MTKDESKKLAMLGAQLLDSKKAHDIVIIDISQKASFADYFVIAGASNERQLGALADDIDDGYAKENLLCKGIEGRKESGWILMDFGDIIVNIFSDEMRQRYNIEKVWGDCETIEFQEGN